MMISPIAAWHSRNRAITSSGSELSEKPVKPRRSQYSAVISRRWLSSCFSAPDATIRSATCGGRKTSQSAHALDFAHLVGDTLFKLLVQVVKIIEQPRVLDGDDRLRGKILHQLDLLVGERPHLGARQPKSSNRNAVPQHRNAEICAKTPTSLTPVILALTFPIGNMNNLPFK